MSRNLPNFRSLFSPERRSARTTRWSKRFRKFSLSSWQSSRIVEQVTSMFRAGSLAAQSVRRSTSSQLVGAGYSRLHVEGLEDRRMLAIDVAVLSTGADDTGMNAIVAQLMDSVDFDFNATLVTAAQIDTPGEIGAFDVVVIGNDGSSPTGGDDFDAAGFSANLRSFVEGGGGVVATGWTLYGTQGESAAVIADLDAILPVNVLGNTYQDTAADGATVDVDENNHPITTGVTDFAIVANNDPPDNFGEVPSLPHDGDTLLAVYDDTNPAIDGDVAGAAGAAGTGRGVYLGPIYAARAIYDTTALRSGEADQMLEQAVAWADNFVAGPPTAVYVDDDFVQVVNGSGNPLIVDNGDIVSSDADGGDDTVNFQNKTFGTDAFATIQGGVDAVAVGGTVFVNAGTYNESILINKSIDVLGRQAGVDARGRVAAESIIRPSAINELVGVVQIGEFGDDVTFDGFTVDGDGAAIGGVVLAGGGDSNARRGIVIDGDNAGVLNNRVQNLYGRGIQSWVNPAVAPVGGVVSQNDIDNIGIAVPTGANSGDGILAFSALASITNNRVTDATTGITAIQLYPAVATTTAISGNNITATNGIALNEISTASTVNVNNNTVTTTGGVGLTLWSIDGTANIGTSIVNTFSGTGGTGIYAWDGTGPDNPSTPSAPSPMSVTVTGGSFTGYTTGALLVNNETAFGQSGDDATLILSGVTLAVAVGGTGVSVQDTVLNKVTIGLTNSTKIQNGATGLNVSGADAEIDGITLNNTEFSGQTGQYILLGAGGHDNENINATGVLFDGQTGASASLAQNFDIEDKITHEVDNATLGFVRVKALNVFVTPSSGSIQRGIDSADAGDTVNVEAGTYAETLLIDKSLRLLGDDAVAGNGAGDVIVNPGGANTNVVVITSSNVEVAGLTVEGSGMDSRGILATHAVDALTGLNIHHNAVRNFLRRGIQSDTYRAEFDIHDNVVSNITGAADAIGIFNYGGGGLPGAAQIRSNTITGSTIGIGGQQSAGMHVLNNNVTMPAGGIGIADFNPGTGAPPVAGATEEFRNNTVTGGDVTSAGIIVIHQAMNVLVKDNTATTPGTGLGVFGSFTATTTTFDHNTVAAGDIGIQVDTDSLVAGPKNVSAIITNDNSITGANVGIQITEDTGFTATVQITDNDNSITGNVVGIEINGGTVGVTGNTLSNNGTGVLFNSGTATVKNNFFVMMAGQTGVNVSATAATGDSILIEDNSFDTAASPKSSATGLINNSSLAIDAQPNYWGAVHGPTTDPTSLNPWTDTAFTPPTGVPTGVLVDNNDGGSILIAPWYKSGVDSSAAPGFQPSGLDTVAPTTTITSVTNVVSTSPTITGTTEPFSLVRVFIDGVFATQTVDSDGNGIWSVTVGPLSFGPHTAQALSVDQSGNVGPLSPATPFAFTVFATTLDLVTDSASPNTSPAGTATDNLTNVNTPTFTGTTAPGATVEVGTFVDSNNNNIVDTAGEIASFVPLDAEPLGPPNSVTANGAGVFTATLAVALVDGTYEFVARATDASNNTAFTNSIDVRIDSQITVTTPDMTAATDDGASNTDNVTSDNTPDFTGTVGPAGPPAGPLDSNSDGAFVELIYVSGPGAIIPGTVLGSDLTDVNGVYLITPTMAIPNGVQTVRVRATDEAGNVVESGTFTFTIDTINDAPTAGADSATTAEDTAVTINVLDNDTGGPPSENQDVEITAASDPVGGSVVINDNPPGTDDTITYTPDANFFGTDTFTYTITDDGGNTATATVTVTVTPVNDPPVAGDDSASTNEDTATTISVLANDNGGPANENQTLTVSVTGTSAQGGTLSTNGTTVTYTPAANFFGTDTFTYTVTDSGGATDTATVTVTVASVNDPPVAGDDAASTNEDTATTISVLANDNGGPANESQTLTVSVAGTSAQGGTLSTNGTTVTYTPPSNFSGTDTFSYTVTDSGGLTDTATVTVTVGAVNDAPVAVDDVIGTPEDTAITVTEASLTGNDTDVDGGPLDITAVSNSTGGVAVLNGDGTITFTPTANFSGVGGFDYTVSDGSATDVGHVTVNIGAVADAPTVTGTDLVVPESDSQQTLFPEVSAAVTDPSETLVELRASGVTGFDFRVNDVGAPDDTGNYTLAGLNGLTVTFDNAGNGGTLDVTGTFSLDGVLGEVVFTITTPGVTSFALNAGALEHFGIIIPPNQNPSFDVTFRAISQDGASQASGQTTINVDVTPVNDAPVAVDDTIATNEDTPITVTEASLTGNDTDIDGGPLDITAVSNSTNGLAVLNGDGTITFTPAPNFSGVAGFDYTVSDGAGGTDIGHVTVNVGAVNDAPTVVLTPSTASAVNGQTITFTFDTTDVDSIGPFTRVISSSNPADVITSLTFNPATGDGTFNVTFAGPPGASTSVITVTVTDPGGASGSDSTAVSVSNTFRVVNFVQNDSGFDVTFNRALDLNDLNLYDSINPVAPGPLRTPDLTLTGAVSGNVKGSVVYNPDTFTLSFVKTGGPLTGDNYTVTLVSGDQAFEDTLFGNPPGDPSGDAFENNGNDLDGDGFMGQGDGVAGGNFVRTFPVVIVGGTPIVSMPDFARGPGQMVDLTANNGSDVTLPVRATGTNVFSVDFDLVYDTRLLTINPFIVGGVSAVRPGWTVTANQTVSGFIATLEVTASGTTPFSGTDVNVVNITAAVPTTAPYGASQVLRLQNSFVNEDNALDDAAIEKVYFPGDANGSGILTGSAPPSAYTGEDAALISRVVVNISTGFDATPLVDPAIVGDASGNGSLTGFDASLVQREAGGENTPETPDETAPGTGGMAAFDPELSIAEDIFVNVNGPVTIPVNITIEPTVLGTVSATYTVEYDTAVLDYVSAELGAEFPASAGWSISATETSPGTIQVAMSSAFVSSNFGSMKVELSRLNFIVVAATTGMETELKINPVDPNELGLSWTKDDGSAISTFTADFDRDGDVDGADLGNWKAGYGTQPNARVEDGDEDRDGDVDGNDFLNWQRQVGRTVFTTAASATAVAAVAAPLAVAFADDAAPAAAELEAAPLAGRASGGWWLEMTSNGAGKRSEAKSTHRLDAAFEALDARSREHSLATQSPARRDAKAIELAFDDDAAPADEFELDFADETADDALLAWLGN